MNPDAVYFTPENINIKADGSMGVSDALQQVLPEGFQSMLYFSR
jgi:hypothetical protein